MSRKPDAFARQDVYRCPTGERLIYRYTREQDGKNLRYYWTQCMFQCPLKSTTGPERRIAMGA